MEDIQLIKLRDNLESYIKNMQGRPIHLIDISRLLEILRDGGIKCQMKKLKK